MVVSRTPKQIVRKFKALIRQGKNMSPVNIALGRLIVTSVKRNFREGGRPVKWKQSGRSKRTGRKTMIVSQKLINSISFDTSKNRVTVGTNQKKAPILHFGGTIVPKNAKALTIPVGLTDFEIRQGKKAKDFSNTFVAKGMIFQNLGNGNIRLLYALKKKVDIPARPFLMIQHEDRKRALELISNHLIKKGYLSA